MTPDQIRSCVRELVAGLVPVPDDDTEPLELESLAMISLVEELEVRLDIRVGARDVIPEHFATVALIVDYVGRKRGGAP